MEKDCLAFVWVRSIPAKIMAQFGSTQLLMMIVVLLSSAVTFLEAARSAGCDAESPIIEGSAYAAGLRTGQSSKHSMRHNGVWRYFNAHLPAGYDHTIAYPLVLSFHGWGSDKVRSSTRDDRLARIVSDALLQVLSLKS